MRYVGYVRISSEEQCGNYSLAAQKHAIQAWVANQQGSLAGTSVQIYEDECFTGLANRRPAFQQMMQDARENKKELPGLLMAMESYSTGCQSDNKVALLLNQAGYVTKQGKSFTGEMVREMLQNRLYIGEVRYQRYRCHSNGSRDSSSPVEWFKGQHPPLVPIKLFERCQEVRRLLRRRPNQADCFEVYLLSGLVYCAHCEKRLRAQKSPCGIRYYRCTYLVEGKRCQRHMIPAEAVESQELTLILRIVRGNQETSYWVTEIAQ